NVKALKFSSQFVEALITADEVDGHRLFEGHARRPNLLTYALTANEPMLSKDLASRSVPVYVRQARKSPAWDMKMQAMLPDQHFLRELYADVGWHLQLPVKGPEGGPDQAAGSVAYDRWALWWREVASRVCQDDAHFEAVLAAVNRRRGDVDADLS